MPSPRPPPLRRPRPPRRATRRRSGPRRLRSRRPRPSTPHPRVTSGRGGHTRRCRPSPPGSRPGGSPASRGGRPGVGRPGRRASSRSGGRASGRRSSSGRTRLRDGRGGHRLPCRRASTGPSTPTARRRLRRGAGAHGAEPGPLGWVGGTWALARTRPNRGRIARPARRPPGRGGRPGRRPVPMPGRGSEEDGRRVGPAARAATERDSSSAWRSISSRRLSQASPTAARTVRNEGIPPRSSGGKYVPP